MARPFVQNLAIYSNQNLLNSIHNLPNYIKRLGNNFAKSLISNKNRHRVLKLCQSGEILPNMVVATYYLPNLSSANSQLAAIHAANCAFA